MPIAKDETVAMLAYAYWETDGRPDGRAMDHWLKAEKAIEERSFKDSARTAKKVTRDKKALNGADAKPHRRSRPAAGKRS